MKIPTNIQYIEQNGKPVFAVIPYDEYIKLLPSEDVTIPHEVVGFVTKKGMHLADTPLPFANSSRQIFLDGDLPIRDSHSMNSHPCRAYISAPA